MKRSILPVIRLDVPCQLPWDQLSLVDGDPNERHCSQCQLNVRDLSAMSADEAQAYLNRQEGRTCVSFMQDTAGRVVTLDYQAPRDQRRWPAWMLGATLTAGSLGVGAVVTIGSQTRVLGGVRPPMSVGVYSPFAPNANPSCASQTRLVGKQLRADPALKPLVAALPDGIEVLDLQYNVHPTNLSTEFGRCVVLGRRADIGEASEPSRQIDAVIWVMSKGYADRFDLTKVDDDHPLRLLSSTPGGDVLIWTEDAELERVLETVEFTNGQRAR